VSSRDRYEHTRTLRIYAHEYEFGYTPVYENYEWIYDRAFDSGRFFVKEWAEDNGYDLDDATEDQVREAVVWRIQENISNAAFEAETEFRAGLIQEWADEQLEKWSPTMDPVESVRLEGGEIVLVITRAINQMDAADEGVDSPWPGTWQRIDAHRVINMLQRAADVSDREIERRHEREFRDLDPDTGSYRDLVAVAEQALKDSGWVPGEEDDEDDES
jgi:hypothetical protein